MPVVLISTWSEMTPEQYEQMVELTNWNSDPAPGALLHLAAFEDGELHVVDIWESAEHYQRFIEERVMPLAQAAGMTSGPDVHIYPIHNLSTPGFAPIETRSAVDRMGGA